MQNLLPNVSEKFVANRKAVNKFTLWSVDDADPNKAVISRKLQKEFTVDSKKPIKYRKPIKQRPEPNYVSPQTVSSIGPSPLNKTIRSEEVEEPTLNMATMVIDTGIPLPKENPKIKIEKRNNTLFVRLISKMSIPTDFFIQKDYAMRVLSISPNTEQIK